MLNQTLLPDRGKQNDDIPGHEFRIADLDERSERIRRAVLPADIEYDSSEYWDRMRRMSKAESWNESAQMTDMLFSEVRAEIVEEHPDWNEQQRKVEFVARMYGPTLAGHFQRHLEKIQGQDKHTSVAKAH